MLDGVVDQVEDELIEAVWGGRIVSMLAIPVTLLGCMSPFAIRLAVQDVAEAGRVSGRIYATSTLGSLLGTYLPVLITIPLLGSRITAVLFGSLLILVGLVYGFIKASLDRANAELNKP